MFMFEEELDFLPIKQHTVSASKLFPTRCAIFIFMSTTTVSMIVYFLKYL